MKLKGYKEITGKIEVMTGLHIGGTTSSIEIGGVDSPVIKHPLSGEPYIPGSSIKGKMRSLLEWKLGKIDEKGEPHKWCDDNECPICRIFGASDEKKKIGPTRIIFRDAFLNKEYLKKEGISIFDIIEEKTENAINRITARANPRQLERVVSGTIFDFSATYQIFDLGDGDNGDIDTRLFENIENGIKLINQTALGKGSSRGSGRVNIQYEVKDINLE